MFIAPPLAQSPVWEQWIQLCAASGTGMQKQPRQESPAEVYTSHQRRQYSGKETLLLRRALLSRTLWSDLAKVPGVPARPAQAQVQMQKSQT